MTTIDSALSLGAALRAARKRLGLTQSELALAAGVGLRFIVELEGGKATVRLAQVLRVVDALGGSLALTGMDAGRAVAELGPPSPQPSPAQAGEGVVRPGVGEGRAVHRTAAAHRGWPTPDISAVCWTADHRQAG